MQSEYTTEDVKDIPTYSEPQPYPIDQITECRARDPVNKETCITICSAITLKKKKCIRALGFPGTHPGWTYRLGRPNKTPIRTRLQQQTTYITQRQPKRDKRTPI